MPQEFCAASAGSRQMRGRPSSGCAARRASTSPARASTLSSASSSARVGPAVRMATRARAPAAALASRNADQTISEEPTTSSASHASAAASALARHVRVEGLCSPGEASCKAHIMHATDLQQPQPAGSADRTISKERPSGTKTLP